MEWKVRRMLTITADCVEIFTAGTGRFCARTYAEHDGFVGLAPAAFFSLRPKMAAAWSGLGCSLGSISSIRVH